MDPFRSGKMMGHDIEIHHFSTPLDWLINDTWHPRNSRWNRVEPWNHDDFQNKKKQKDLFQVDLHVQVDNHICFYIYMYVIYWYKYMYRIYIIYNIILHFKYILTVYSSCTHLKAFPLADGVNRSFLVIFVAWHAGIPNSGCAHWEFQTWNFRTLLGLAGWLRWRCLLGVTTTTKIGQVDFDHWNCTILFFWVTGSNYLRVSPSNDVSPDTLWIYLVVWFWCWGIFSTWHLNEGLMQARI